MTSILRQVLEQFDATGEPLSLDALAGRLQITQGVLQGMLDHWVRKGELREVTSDSAQCTHCSIQTACPFVIAMPRYYERVTDHAPQNSTCGGASCQCATPK